MAAKSKTRTETFTGVVERCEQQERAPFMLDRYGPPRERTEFVLDICLRLDDGRAVYFKPKAASRTIGMGGLVAVVLHWVDGEAANWWRETTINGEEKRAVASAGRPNNNVLEPLVKVGDRITVTGRIKSEAISKRGNPYVVITHVQKQEG